MKMRGNTHPEPSYSPDVAGLLQWLRQPPSQWSALGWKNAPAWADALGKLIESIELDLDQAIFERDEAKHDRDNYRAERDATEALLDDAITERDSARRMYCRAWVDLTGQYQDDSLEDAARKVAKNLDWNCFDECKGEVTR